MFNQISRQDLWVYIKWGSILSYVQLRRSYLSWAHNWESNWEPQDSLCSSRKSIAEGSLSTGLL